MAETPASAPTLDHLMSAADQAFTSGDLNEARCKLNDAVRLAPGSAAAHLALGLVCHRLEDFPSARDAFSCATEIDQQNINAHTNLAIVLQRMGQTAQAETALQAALTLNKDNPDLQQMLAMLKIERRQFVAAAHILHKLVLQRPRDPVLLVALGKCFYHEGDTDTARSCFEWALQSEPGHELAWQNLEILKRQSLAAA